MRSQTAKSNKSFNSKSSKTSPLKYRQSTPSSPLKEQLIYNALKPVVNDYTKLCRKGTCRSKSKEKTSRSSNSINFGLSVQPEFKLEFLPQKEFDIEEFIKSNTKEEIKCQICGKFYTFPLSCYKCNKIFCSECIKAKLEKQHKCPKCFNIIFHELMPALDEEKIKSLQLNQSIKCPYTGCKESHSITNIKHHLENCIFREASNTKMKHVNKIIYQSDHADPCMKTHMLNYLKFINTKIANLGGGIYANSNILNTNYNFQLSKNDNNTTSDGNIQSFSNINFSPKLSDFNGQAGFINDYISKSIMELAKTTKNTNETLKSLINK